MQTSDWLQGEHYRNIKVSEGEDSDIRTGTFDLLYRPD